MNTEVRCSLIALVGVLVSAVVAYLVSRNEIKKLKLTWIRDDSLTFNDDFKETCSCILNYLDTGSEHHRKIAYQQVFLLQSSAPKSMVPTLKKLQAHLEAGNKSKVEELLQQLISLKNNT